MGGIAGAVLASFGIMINKNPLGFFAIMIPYAFFIIFIAENIFKKD